MTLWNIQTKLDNSFLENDNTHSLFLKQILYNRGILEDTYLEFLNPSKMGDPFKFNDMKKVVARIGSAIKKGEKILVYGDYDVDGITGTTALFDFLKSKLNANVSAFLPSRFTDGYGLNANRIKKAKDDGYSIIITVDCGIRDVDNIDLANKLGMDVIITDHHLMGKKLPNAFAIIHPALGYGYTDLTGCGVAFKLISALAKGKYDVTQYLDLVALSIICDVVPVTGENRFMLKTGLDIINSKNRVGLKHLMDVSSIDQADVYHLGFVLGPKLNAAGRLYDAFDGLNLLLEEDNTTAHNYALKLHVMNMERQKMMKEGVDMALKQINYSDNFNIVEHDSWGEGIVGLIAGRLTEETGKPTIALTCKEGDLYIGSARSIKDFNIVKHLEDISELLESFGGHKYAAGLKIRKKNIEKFRISLEKIAKEEFKNRNFDKTINIDAIINLEDITFDLYRELLILKPYGVSNPEPLFLIENVKVLSAYNVGNNEKFIKMKFGNRRGSVLIDAIWFNSIYSPLQIINFSYIDVVANIDINSWNDRKILQLKIVDLKAKIM